MLQGFPTARGAKRTGRTELSAPTDGTSYPKGICSAALHCRTPSPTARSAVIARSEATRQSVLPLPPSAREVAARSADGGRDKMRHFLSPSRLRRQPPPRGGLTTRQRRAVGTMWASPPTKRHGARACGRTESSAPLQRKKRRLPPSLFIQLYCRTTAVTLPSRVA